MKLLNLNTWYVLCYKALCLDILLCLMTGHRISILRYLVHLSVNAILFWTPVHGKTSLWGWDGPTWFGLSPVDVLCSIPVCVIYGFVALKTYIQSSKATSLGSKLKVVISDKLHVEEMADEYRFNMQQLLMELRFSNTQLSRKLEACNAKGRRVSDFCTLLCLVVDHKDKEHQKAASVACASMQEHARRADTLGTENLILAQDNAQLREANSEYNRKCSLYWQNFEDSEENREELVHSVEFYKQQCTLNEQRAHKFEDRLNGALACLDSTTKSVDNLQKVAAKKIGYASRTSETLRLVLNERDEQLEKAHNEMAALKKTIVRLQAGDTKPKLKTRVLSGCADEHTRSHPLWCPRSLVQQKQTSDSLSDLMVHENANPVTELPHAMAKPFESTLQHYFQLAVARSDGLVCPHSRVNLLGAPLGPARLVLSLADEDGVEPLANQAECSTLLQREHSRFAKQLKLKQIEVYKANHEAVECRLKLKKVEFENNALRDVTLDLQNRLLQCSLYEPQWYDVHNGW